MSGTPMKYPYTFSAKIARFPFDYFFFKTKQGWVIRYWTLGVIVSLPMFYAIEKLSYSPENVKKWQEIREHQFSTEMRH